MNALWSPVLSLIGQKWNFNSTVLVLSLVLWSFSIGYDLGLKRFEESWRKQYVVTKQRMWLDQHSYNLRKCTKRLDNERF